jgi:AraC-like DNA-binding protein
MNKFMERASYKWSEDSIRLIMTPGVTAKSCYFYISEKGYFKTSPGYYTERQNLNSYLIIYTLSGNGYLKYEDKQYNLTRGKVFFIDCMEYHHYFTDSKTPWEFLWVHFNGSTSRGYYEEFAKNSSPVATLDEATPVPSIILELISLCSSKYITAELLCSKLLVNLMTELILDINVKNTSSLIIPSYITDIMRELDKHFTESISLNELSHRYGISKFYLIRQFKKYTGFTPNEYIINSRISYAKELLQYSNLPVSEISIRTGVENVSHFINLFKGREGDTPLAFRKKWSVVK